MNAAHKVRMETHQGLAGGDIDFGRRQFGVDCGELAVDSLMIEP
jgi:hypothetical protein